jgi:hypothetical protein
MMTARLHDYTYVGGGKKHTLLLAGFGSLYNSSESSATANLTYVRRGKNMVFIAARNVRKGAELLHFYGTEYWNSRGVTPQ